MKYSRKVSIALSQLWNAAWGGMPDETICSRAWRQSEEGVGWARAFVKVVNAFFFWQRNHCRGAYNSELAKLHQHSHFKPRQ